MLSRSELEINEASPYAIAARQAAGERIPEKERSRDPVHPEDQTGDLISTTAAEAAGILAKMRAKVKAREATEKRRVAPSEGRQWRTPLLAEAVGPSPLNALRDELIKKHNLSTLRLTHKPYAKTIEVTDIAVHPDHRGQGHARRAMNALTAHADATDHDLAIHPDPGYGSSKKRLTRWYHSHGFVPNKGKNFSTKLSMIRKPRV